jgi:hypothetical protein
MTMGIVEVARLATTGEIDLQRDQLGCLLCQAIKLVVSKSMLKDEIFTFDPAQIPESFYKSRPKREGPVVSTGEKHSNLDNFGGLLCPGHHRPRRRSAKSTDELAPSHPSLPIKRE